MNLKSSSKSGFTLIELLVVMLILVILTVTALPAIREYMIRARYTADVDPAIGNIRTKVELYRYEHDHLPGMAQAKGKSVLHDHSSDTTYSDKVTTSFSPDLTVTPAASGTPGDVSDIQPTSPYIHTMSYDETDSENSGKYAYITYDWDGTTSLDQNTTGNSGLHEAIDAGDVKALSWHAFKQTDITYNDLRARFVSPFNFQYAVVFNRGEDYCWVVGAMGNGGGLPVGTGYAVLEYNNTALKTKFVATFERYKAEQSQNPLTLGIEDFGVATGFDPTQPQDPASKAAIARYVVVPSLLTTFPSDATIQGATSAAAGSNPYSTEQGLLDIFRDALVDAGWKVE